MTATSSDVRVRRPQDHAALVEELHTDANWTYRDILLFSAAVGYAQQRRVPFTSSAGDPVRYETLTQPQFSEALVAMIAANTLAEDPEILDVNRLEERVRIFEEYSNGGLEYLQETINTQHLQPTLAVIHLVTAALASDGGAKPMSVADLLGGARW